MNGISGIVISYNEEKKIGACLAALQQVADELIVLDSFSTDHTVTIARQCGARIIQSEFSDYISQKNKALALASYNYVLLLDADEVLSDHLVISIREEKKHLKHEVYFFNRLTSLAGTFISYGLWYPDRKPRLFKKQNVFFGGLNPHDKLLMKIKSTSKKLNGKLLHLAFDTIEEYKESNHKVSSIAAQAMFDAGIKFSWAKIVCSPVWAFVNGYILRLGFLNGRKGWIVAAGTTRQCFYKYKKLKQIYQYRQKQLAWH